MVVALLTNWVLTRKRRRSADALALFGLISESRGERLIEFSDNFTKQRDEDLWKAIGGCGGVLSLYRDAGLIVEAVGILAKRFPEQASNDYERLWIEAIYLRFSVIGCLFENCFTSLSSRVPRIQARGCAQMYTDIWLTARVLFDACTLSGSGGLEAVGE